MSQTGHYTPPPQQQVIYGKPVAEALAAELERRKATRVVFVTNTSLAGAGKLGESVKASLGSACVAEVTGIGAHSPRTDVVRMANTMASEKADLVIALGGGSVCDATKAATLALANNVSEAADIDRLRTPQTGPGA